MEPYYELYYIDKDTPVPLYYQLKKRILTLIGNQTLKVGDMLPPENELCEYLGISRPTVRQAMRELVSEGYLSRQKGRGTFVAEPKMNTNFMKKLESFQQEMLQKGLIPSTQVLCLERCDANPSINELLEIPLDAPLVHLERLRCASGEPVAWIKSYLSFERFSSLLEEDLASSSLYALLEKKFQVRITRIHREIGAVNATSKEAQLLHVQEGAALCFVNTTAYACCSSPIEISSAYYRGDRNKFSADLYR